MRFYLLTAEEVIDLKSLCVHVSICAFSLCVYRLEILIHVIVLLRPKEVCNYENRQHLIHCLYS